MAGESLNLAAPRNPQGRANVIHPPLTISMPANPVFFCMKHRCGFAMRLIGAADCDEYGNSVEQSCDRDHSNN
jgi:hypothetical protein